MAGGPSFMPTTFAEHPVFRPPVKYVNFGLTAFLARASRIAHSLRRPPDAL